MSYYRNSNGMLYNAITGMQIYGSYDPKYDTRLSKNTPKEKQVTSLPKSHVMALSTSEKPHIIMSNVYSVHPKPSDILPKITEVCNSPSDSDFERAIEMSKRTAISDDEKRKSNSDDDLQLAIALSISESDIGQSQYRQSICDSPKIPSKIDSDELCKIFSIMYNQCDTIGEKILLSEIYKQLLLNPTEYIELVFFHWGKCENYKDLLMSIFTLKQEVLYNSHV